MTEEATPDDDASASEQDFVVAAVAYTAALERLLVGLRALDEYSGSDDTLDLYALQLTASVLAEYAQEHLIDRDDVSADARRQMDGMVCALIDAVYAASEQALAVVTHPPLRGTLAGIHAANVAQLSLDDFLRSLRPDDPE